MTLSTLLYSLIVELITLLLLLKLISTLINTYNSNTNTLLQATFQINYIYVRVQRLFLFKLKKKLYFSTVMVVRSLYLYIQNNYLKYTQIQV